MKPLLNIALALFVSMQVQSQQKTITGTVTASADGLPLPGVNITIKGTTTGVQTNFDGLYTILAKTGDVLSFSFIGMQTKEVVVKDQTVIDVVLEGNSSSLEEVVVVGYGSNVRGETKSHRRTKQRNIQNALKGSVAGVQVVSGSGAPASNTTIRIRGYGSLNGTKEPVYVVDGKIATAEQVKSLKPENISEINVLKSVNASAIYGNRGADGAVVIQTKNGNFQFPDTQITNNESYEEIVENSFLKTTLSPLSTFSIDVDKASYSNIRRMINNGQQIPADAVKIEEMVNYFHYNYPQPTGIHPFSINTEVTKTPWHPDTRLVKIGLQGKSYENDELPPANLTFLVDVSGSMNHVNKLPLLKSALKLLVGQLREKDKVAIVVYAGAAGMVLPPTSGANKEKIIEALDRLNAGGSTAGGAGINLAYKIAQENFMEKGNNRVVLATDGDFNVGESSDRAMGKLIEEKRKSGIFLSVLGFGYGNYKDSKLETLADKGNGNHAYIDTMQEAQKVFGKEFGGTLYTIAKDVKIQIEFNPKKVRAYRLIGYENRLLADEDFIDDSKDAGELGSGHTVTALYEIIPFGVESEYLKETDTLKYTTPTSLNTYSNELFTVKFRYKKPDGNKSIEIVHVQKDELTEASEDFKFASSVALFGMQLKHSIYDNKATIQDVMALAINGRGEDKDGYRSEFIRLLKSYQNL